MKEQWAHDKSSKCVKKRFWNPVTVMFTQFDQSVSPSPRTQTSQWQSSISCTGSGSQTSLGFSAVEKHWKMWSSHRFYGVYASKMEKQCAWGSYNTDSRYPERMGNIIYFISWIQTKQSKMSLSIQPQYKWRQKRSFFGRHTLIKLQFFICRTLMLSCALARYFWLTLVHANVTLQT